MARTRPVLTETAVLEALAHPVRLDVLNHLMADGPATASACARAVGDTPSNCSYHLRVLAQHGLVTADQSTDARERPWRATITGYRTDDGAPGSRQARGSAALRAASLQRDQQLSRAYLAQRDRVPAEWRAADAHATYTLRATPTELTDLIEKVDALIRPFISAIRGGGAPPEATLVHLGLHAFPRTDGR